MARRPCPQDRRAESAPAASAPTSRTKRRLHLIALAQQPRDIEPHMRFPYERFGSIAAFRDYLKTHQTKLDARYAFEAERSQDGTPTELQAPGTCGLCLRAAHFTTHKPHSGNGAHVEVNWREQQVCDCQERLTCRFRALLHFITAEIDPPAWTRMLLLGSAQSIEPSLQRLVAQVAVRARAGRLLRAPRFERQAYHLILSSDHLHAEPDLDIVLSRLREALLPGGQMVFTAPFDTGAEASLPPSDDRIGLLGWDILARLAQAGFASPAAHLFWSAEFGYLGPFNLIFTASA
jgi:hypothetical protein